MFYQVKENEKNAMTMINAIRQSLMQCETASKSPVSSPGTPPVYPVQSPVNISPLYTLIVWTNEHEKYIIIAYHITTLSKKWNMRCRTLCLTKPLMAMPVI